MRTRTAVLLTLMTALLLACMASPSSATAAGPTFVAPRSEAIVKHLPVRVAVKVPARARGLRVRLGTRDLTARFRAADGALRVASLTRRDALRYGHNHLDVLVERRGRLSVVDTRSFVLARHDPGLASMRVQPGPVTSLAVRVSAPELKPEHFSQRGQTGRRLAAIGRARLLRASLNGRQVTHAIDRSDPTDWTASLSATHGLRHGVNRLRLLVVEPDRGRYALLDRRFVVRRDLHLAAAGRDIATQVGRRLRLDGRRSRPARGRSIDHSWHIVTKPRGSRAKLRRAGSTRPFLTVDRPGTYVVGLAVTARTARRTASQAAAASADRLTVTVSPSERLVPFKGMSANDAKLSGIQVGGTFYPNRSPNGTSMQWLTLNRATLEPIGDGNSWVDRSGTGDHSVARLSAAVTSGNRDQLVALAFPYSPSNDAGALAANEVDTFVAVLKGLGVDFPVPDVWAIIGEANTIAVLGVPLGGSGSGWISTGGTNVEALEGWLMAEAKLSVAEKKPLFRFQPERLAFDTSSKHTPTTNTMVVGGRSFDAALPAGATGGFQVATFDESFLTSFDQQVFATNGVADPNSALAAMADFVRTLGQEGLLVAVQSIGHVQPPPPPDRAPHWDPRRFLWYDVGTALAGLGANPHIFNTINGSYAFLGGSSFKRSEVVQSSSAIVIEGNPNLREAGTLSGRTSIRPDGLVQPVVADSSGKLDLKLYDMVFRPATPWPYTEAAGESQAYKAALADITNALPRLRSYYPDLRQAYDENLAITYGGTKADLNALPYPGDGRTCTGGVVRTPNDQDLKPLYTREQFCNLVKQIGLEFDWLDATKDLFDAYKDAISRGGSEQLADLEQIGKDIRNTIGGDEAAEIGWSVGAFLGNFTSAAILAGNPEATVALAAWEALVTIYELARELVAATDGKPLGDQVETKVEDLAHELATRLLDAADSLDRLRQVVVSDWGRLQAVGSHADSTQLAADVPSLADSYKTAGGAFFSSQLVPIPFGVHALQHDTFPDTTVNTNNCWSHADGYTWNGAPPEVQLDWMGDFNRDGARGWFPTRFVLGWHSLGLTYYAYPPAKVAQYFRPIVRNGYALDLARFVWEQYENASAPVENRFPPTDIFVCK